MSAIYGAIALKNKKVIQEENKAALREAFKGCQIDRYQETDEEGIFMGCGLQYFTDEARYEKLPYSDERICFDADAILDNREEVAGKYNISADNQTGDGEIIVKAFKKDRNKAVRDMIGAYSFVYYDKSTKEIYIVSDAVGYRYVYYTIKNDVLYYSSLMAPLEKIIGDIKLNEKWIAYDLAQDNLNIFMESEMTPIEDIYRIAPAHMMKISYDGRIEKEHYWTLDNIKKIRLKNNDEYKKAFLEVYQKCIDQTLRTSEETAVFLSGGYDSTSVACLAANTLKKRNKKLYSFTAVPFKGYKVSDDRFAQEDETEDVLKTCRIYENIEPEFLDMSEVSLWHARKEYMKISEIPYKSPQNMLWLYEGMKEAGKKNARIMLGGMFGNGTVSFENAEVLFIWYMRTGRLFSLYKQIKGMQSKNGFSRKKILKSTFNKAFFPEKNTHDFEDYYKNIYVSMDYLQKYKAAELNLQRWNDVIKKSGKCSEMQKSFMALDTFRHYGEFMQKNSLYTGVIIRDPTRDKRIIEFCLGIPYDQYTHNGYMRALIADYMQDIVPAHIIKSRRRGVQSADFKARMLKEEAAITDEWKQSYIKHMDNERICCDKLLKELGEKKMFDMSNFEIMRHVFLNIMLEYIDSKQK